MYGSLIIDLTRIITEITRKERGDRDQTYLNQFTTKGVMERLVSLADELDPLQVGIIAAQRSKLLKAGVPVAPGFVLTPQFFKQLLVEQNLHEHFFTTVKSAKDIQEIHAFINQLKISEDIEDEVLTACEPFKGSVAITTSSVFDDAVFAVHNIPQQQVMDRVKSCWASLFHESRKGWLNRKTLFPSLIFQKDVEVVKSGVLYTHNPVNKAASRIVVEIQHPGQMSFAIRREDGEVVGLKGEATHAPLSETERKELITIAKQVEKAFKVPQKVDWIKGDELYVLESRDITEEDARYFFSQSTSSGSSENSSESLPANTASCLKMFDK